MRLVQPPIDERVVQAAVDPVDAEVGEEQEDGELEDVVPEARAVRSVVVQLAEAADLGEEAGDGTDGHGRHGAHGLLDFRRDLVLEELGMVECLLVENKQVRERRKHEVSDKAKDPAWTAR